MLNILFFEIVAKSELNIVTFLTKMMMMTIIMRMMNCFSKMIDQQVVEVLFGTKHSRMDQVKFVEGSL